MTVTDSTNAYAMVVGEALVDVLAGPDGEEYPVPGGSPANVALGLARLGRPTRLLTQLGRDAYGELVREHLTTAGVDVRPIGRPGVPTSSARAVLGADGSAAYSFDLVWDIQDEPVATAPVHVHTGSIAATLAPGSEAVRRLLLTQRERASISYDPNVRPALMRSPAAVLPTIEGLVPLSDVVKASEEDIDWLYPSVTAETVARDWLATGPALVVITRGDAGSIAVTRAGTVTLPAVRTELVDTVGAGDAFMSGLLDGLWARGLVGAQAREDLRHITPVILEEVLRHASRAAAITVSRQGAQPPNHEELRSLLPQG